MYTHAKSLEANLVQALKGIHTVSTGIKAHKETIEEILIAALDSGTISEKIAYDIQYELDAINSLNSKLAAV